MEKCLRGHGGSAGSPEGPVRERDVRHRLSRGPGDLPRARDRDRRRGPGRRRREGPARGRKGHPLVRAPFEGQVPRPARADAARSPAPQAAFPADRRLTGKRQGTLPPGKESESMARNEKNRTERRGLWRWGCFFCLRGSFLARGSGTTFIFLTRRGQNPCLGRRDAPFPSPLWLSSGHPANCLGPLHRI